MLIYRRVTESKINPWTASPLLKLILGYGVPHNHGLKNPRVMVIHDLDDFGVPHFYLTTSWGFSFSDWRLLGLVGEQLNLYNIRNIMGGMHDVLLKSNVLTLQ